MLLSRTVACMSKCLMREIERLPGFHTLLVSKIFQNSENVRRQTSWYRNCVDQTWYNPDQAARLSKTREQNLTMTHDGGHLPSVTKLDLFSGHFSCGRDHHEMHNSYSKCCYNASPHLGEPTKSAFCLCKRRREMKMERSFEGSIGFQRNQHGWMRKKRAVLLTIANGLETA
jgi:hypothetical protein